MSEPRPALSDPDEAFQRMLLLLQAKDDTSRFVGLALLKSLLDNQVQLRENAAKIRTLWQSISPSFLDRLLRAAQSPKVSAAESRDMVDLAVGVLHTFTLLLAAGERTEKRIVGRIGPLTNVLVTSSPTTTTLILQALLTLVSQLQGALELLKAEDLSPLIEIAPQQSMALDVIYYAWSNASADPAESQNVLRQVDLVVPRLVTSFKGTDAVTFLSFMGNVMPKLAFDTRRKPTWLEPLTQNLKNLVMSRPTQAGRSAYTTLGAALLQVFPETCPGLLFKDNNITSTPKPFSYLFINLLLTDIRSTFPTLLSLLNSPSYPAISQRLSSAFDITSAFIGYLVKSLDSPEDTINDEETTLIMSPDLLLKLRRDIAETMSLTIEFLRDRYDASTAGAPYLDPSARPATSITSSGSLLTLTWDSASPCNQIPHDPLTLAALRTLSLWLREDDNENLRSECAGLMDLFMHLYSTSLSDNLDKPPHLPDFRPPVLAALEGILPTPAAYDAFLAHSTWSHLATTLIALLRLTHSTALTAAQSRLGIEVIRTLLLVLDHDCTPDPADDDWITLLLAPLASLSLRHHTPHPTLLEFEIATVQLATALFLKARGAVRRENRRHLSAVLGVAQQLLRQKEVRGEWREELEGLMEELEMCRCR